MSDDKDYAHQRDPEAQRTRYELWAIIIIVVVVVVGAVIFRAVAHRPAGPQKGYGPSPAGAAGGASDSMAPAAGAGIHPSAPPPPRPVSP